MLLIHQVNLQTLVGGGEYYTRAFSRALLQAGAKVRLYVQRDNRFWDSLAGSGVEVVPVTDPAGFESALPERGALLMTQTMLPPAVTERLARKHVLTGFAHLPLHERPAEPFRRYRAVFTVSQYCVHLLRAAGLGEQTYAEPLYGTYDLQRPPAHAIRAGSPYAWDRRKLRDRVLGMLEPILPRARAAYAKSDGLVLGIVSLIAPIKQFPALFALLAPFIARFPQVRLEIFGSGGYAQVRDLKQALRPMRRQVGFWGYQPSVQAVYPQIDYLMTGLPEKEALGLNAIESQACGTPVLAPRAPPFTETVLDGATGFLYADPRLDRGKDFAALLESLVAGRPRPDPRLARAHLAKFSEQALAERTRRLADHLRERFAP